jgi:hypothetical protein
MGPTALLSERRRAEGFSFALKNPTASAGFEPPQTLGSKGQHDNSRPPKKKKSWSFVNIGLVISIVY